MAQVWYYADDNVNVGPVSRAQLRLFLQSRRGGPAALVWCESFEGWKRADEVAELADMLVPTSGAVRPSPRTGYSPAVTVDRRDVATPHPQPMPTAHEGGRRTVLIVAACIVGVVLGVPLAIVFKASFIWPASLGAIAWLALRACKVQPAALPMMAVLLGHTGWMLVGYVALALTGQTLPHHLLVDMAAVIALSTWFLVTRSRAAAIGMLVYQVVALGGGLLNLGAQTSIRISADDLLLAQSMHLMLRIAGIAACIYAVAKLSGARPDDAHADERVA